MKSYYCLSFPCINRILPIGITLNKNYKKWKIENFSGSEK